MIQSDLDRAKAALQKEADNCHVEILGKLADIAADMGDAELETGYRFLAEHKKWPSLWGHVKEDGTPDYIGWSWDTRHCESTSIHSHEFYDGCTGDYYNLTGDVFDTCSKALEIAARSIGKELHETMQE